MLFLLRKIRRKLMQNLPTVVGNKFTTYLLYALGEIVLVVIGILIAVSINNWNQERKDQQKAQAYLQEFKDDLENNISELDRVIERSTYTSQVCDSLIGHLAADTLNLSVTQISFLILESVGYTMFVFDESTVRDLLGSGNLELIRNDSIRKALGSWDAQLNLLREFESLSKENALVLNDILVAELNTWKPANKIYDASLRPSIERRRFMNLVADRRRMTRRLAEIYKIKRQELQSLLSLVETNLKE